jgi:hypothetical protein
MASIMTTTSSIGLTGLLVLAAACTNPGELARSGAALGGDDPTPDAGTPPPPPTVPDGDPDQLTGNCPENTCGTNSPVIAGVYFSRLHLGGLASPKGVQLTGVIGPNGGPMQLELVDGDRLRGIYTSGQVVEHGALTGTRLGILVQGAAYEILLRGVSQEPFWATASTSALAARPRQSSQPQPQQPQPQLQIESYELHYRPLGTTRDELLCSEADGDPTKLEALVFGGDLYDQATKAIQIGPETDGWLNIACTSNAIYKMHKIGYTSAAQLRLGNYTTLDQRRAMLNAWTANVCGTGKSYTHADEPLTLRESLDVQSTASPYRYDSKTVEAIWGPSGAVCLTDPRLSEEIANLRNQIVAECGPSKPLPLCSELPGAWSAHGYVLTGNP